MATGNTHAAHRATVYGPSSTRPEPMGSWETGFVRRQRAIRASWGDIAKMLGRAEPDVRAAYDPDYRRPSAPPPPRPDASPEKLLRLARGLTERKAANRLSVLQLLRIRSRRLPEICDRLGLGKSGIAAMIEMLQRLDLVALTPGEHGKARVACLTVHGHEVLAAAEKLLSEEETRP